MHSAIYLGPRLSVMCLQAKLYHTLGKVLNRVIQTEKREGGEMEAKGKITSEPLAHKANP